MNASNRHDAFRIIHDEHQTLAAMLRSLQHMMRRGPADHPEPFFDVVRAMLFYIDEFPEKRHHPKESRLLFPMVARCVPSLQPVIEALEQDHQQGEARVRELQHLLLAWELLGEARRERFCEAADAYVNFYLNHIRVEETQLLPAAERSLGAAERAELDAAFAADRDLFSEGARDASYERLFTRIVMHAPAPIGVGPG